MVVVKLFNSVWYFVNFFVSYMLGLRYIWLYNSHFFVYNDKFIIMNITLFSCNIFCFKIYFVWYYNKTSPVFWWLLFICVYMLYHLFFSFSICLCPWLKMCFLLTKYICILIFNQNWEICFFNRLFNLLIFNVSIIF